MGKCGRNASCIAISRVRCWALGVDAFLHLVEMNDVGNSKTAAAIRRQLLESGADVSHISSGRWSKLKAAGRMRGALVAARRRRQSAVTGSSSSSSSSSSSKNTEEEREFKDKKKEEKKIGNSATIPVELRVPRSLSTTREITTSDSSSTGNESGSRSPCGGTRRRLPRRGSVA